MGGEIGKKSSPGEISWLHGVHIIIIILQYNWTSVMLAAKFGHDEVVKELVKRGADLTLKTVRATVHFCAFIMSYYATIIERW